MALGRLTRVVEQPGGLGYLTFYTYNALDKLTQVSQPTGGGPTQNRYFTYDSLGRLLSADNPEDVGTIQYTYDDNGNLTTRTDARGATTTMTYDALNRVTQKTYSGAPGSSPAVRYCYDGNIYDLTTNTCIAASPAIPYPKGKLTGEGVAGWSATNYTGFDSRGRVTASVQRTITSGTAQTAYTFGYTYNRDGTLATQTYPSGKVVSFAYDRGGRPVNVAELTGPLTTYVSSVVYAHHGAPDKIVFGNTLTEQSCYSTRDQLTTRRLGTGSQTNCAASGSDLLHLAFAYATPNTDNGNLTSQTITAPGFSQTQYYGYDGVNRLKAASEGAALTGGGTTCPTTQSWCQENGYDAFGNRWVSFSNRTLHMATPTSAAAFNGSTNRLTGSGITYDNAGNLTAHPFLTPGAGGGMVYNASNKMTQFTATGVSVAYRYDAQQRRVRQDSGGQTTIWVYDAFGQLAAEYSTNLTMTQGVYYRTTDHLGSTRIVTNQSAAVVQRRDFFPFGEAIPADSSHGNRQAVTDGGQATYNTNSGVKQQFTGQQRDEETGLDYFWARNYSAPVGRFLSVDPESAGANHADPRGWNAYAYAYDSPCLYVDRDGRQAEPGSEDWYWEEYYGITFNPWWLQGPWNSYPNTTVVGGDDRTPEEKLLSKRGSAFVRAKQALANEGCRNLYGGGWIGPGWDPLEVLDNPGAFGISIKFDPDANFQGMTAAGPSGITITFNTDWFDSLSVNGMAAALLHELGHAFDAGVAIGSGGSLILSPDSNPFNEGSTIWRIWDYLFGANQGLNHNMILENCGVSSYVATPDEPFSP